MPWRGRISEHRLSASYGLMTAREMLALSESISGAVGKDTIPAESSPQSAASNVIRHANRLAEARTALGMSQRQVAEALGVSRSTYSLYEAGLFLPSREVLERICGLLGKTVEELYPDARSRAFYAGGLIPAQSEGVM